MAPARLIDTSNAPLPTLFADSARLNHSPPTPPTLQLTLRTVFHVGLGSAKQNVSSLRGLALYHQFYEAFLSLCNSNSQSCDRLTGATIDVDFIDGTQLKHGKLSLKVESSVWYNGEQSNDALRLLLIGTVAGAVQAESEDEKSCYTMPYNAGDHQLHYVKHCNIGDTIRIDLKD